MKTQSLRSLVPAATITITFALACATSPTGRKQLLLVPAAQMDAMGAQSFQQLQQETPTDSSPAVNAYVRCVADAITTAAQGQTDVKQWEVKVFKDPTANAFALPGGKIGVNTGLLPVAKTADQLAAVLGHEVGHVIAQHGGERVSQQLATQGGLALVNQFLGGGQSTGGNMLMAALGLGAQVGVLLPFSRTQESEADLIGEKLMAQAGFDPGQSIDLWRNMMAASGGQSPPQWMSTHPASENRIQSLQAHLPEAQSEYERVKAQGKLPRCTPAT